MFYFKGKAIVMMLLVVFVLTLSYEFSVMVFGDQDGYTIARRGRRVRLKKKKEVPKEEAVQPEAEKPTPLPQAREKLPVVTGTTEPPFVYKLLQVKKATVGDAIKLVVFMVDPMQAKNDPKVIAKFLVDKGVVDDDDVTNLGEPITKGLLADMIMRAKDWSGGLFYTIFGGGRYAYRELVFRGIMHKGGSPYQKLTGKELIGIISKASSYDKK